ncbi:hypothetical protein IFM89_017381 [Coptis chinensis]|uniref:Uncharacterized protein n=1 Tax=Coptis chinensis TaxID=261450 RepID=A0A835LVP6_9MAGN|nr:hypothetical protein IFM89_017381 [Coptis chinensis]
MDENGDPAEPLLLQRHDSQVGLAGQSSDAIEELLAQNKTVPYRWWLSLVGWESRILWFLSGASIIVSIFNFMLSLITQMFTGHLGALELAGVSIATVGIQGLAYGIMLFHHLHTMILEPFFSLKPILQAHQSLNSLRQQRAAVLADHPLIGRLKVDSMEL